MDSELTLVFEILQGNPGAARRFYNHFYPFIKRYAMNRTRCPEDAEEIVQDVFLSAIESLALYSGRSKLSTWLCGIARHEISDYYRKKRIRALVMSHVPGLAELIGPEAHSFIDQLALREQVGQVLGRLLPRYALVLKMKYLEGWSVEEIADRLHESFKATETALFRARKAFAVEWDNLEERNL